MGLAINRAKSSWTTQVVTGGGGWGKGRQK